MAKVLKEITTIVGKYTNENGEEKNRYHKVGMIIDTKNGEMLKIDNLPLKEGGWDGWCYINDPLPKDGKKFKKDDDIGF
jgi:hypothetical protein